MFTYSMVRGLHVSRVGRCGSGGGRMWIVVLWVAHGWCVFVCIVFVVGVALRFCAPLAPRFFALGPGVSTKVFGGQIIVPLARI